MRAKWKRNAVIVTMAVLVCAAVGLNWKFSGEEAVKSASQDAEAAGTKILGEATLVSGAEGTDEETGAPLDEDAVYSGSDYFASARLTRQ